MQTATLTITGLSSEAAARTLGATLERIDGIADARISLLRSQVEVRFDDARLELDQLRQALSQAGFPNSTPDTALSGQGSCCGGCCS